MIRIAVVLLCLWPSCVLWGAGKGSTFGQLRAGETVYHNVTVSSVTPRSAFIRHDGGLAQVMFADMDADLQQAFGYDPVDALEYTRQKQTEHERIEKARQEKKAAPVRKAFSGHIRKVMKSFGTPPVLRDAVDLRPRFNEMRLFSKSQGLRPSCSVFAVLTALEYQNALLRGRTEKLSEEYLIWATRAIVASGRRSGLATQSDSEGFALMEVMHAVASFGVATQESMPYRYGRSMSRIKAPTQELVEEARSRQKVLFFIVTGRAADERIANVVHVLNHGTPLAIGLAWPHNSTLQQTNLLGEQVPPGNYNHAVTLVGYKCPSRKIEDTVFIFRNSWGRDWGVNGYGFVSYKYLRQHLRNAIYLDVEMGTVK